MIAAMTTGKSTLTGALDSDDTIAMLDSLQRLGVKASHDAASATMTVKGVGGDFPNKTAELFIGNSGTSIRF